MIQTIEHVTIICKECGCLRDIHEGEIPEGNCDMCDEYFGWVFQPENFKNPLEDGDVVIVDTRLNRKHKDRMFLIERRGEIIYRNEK